MKRLHPAMRAVYLLGLPGGIFLVAASEEATRQVVEAGSWRGYTVLFSVCCFAVATLHMLFSVILQESQEGK